MNKAPTTTKILAVAKAAGLIVTRQPGTLNFAPFYKVQGVAGLLTKGALARRLGYAV